MNALTPSAATQPDAATAVLPDYAVGQIALLRAVAALDAPDIAALIEATGKTSSTVNRDLRKLVGAGLISETPLALTAIGQAELDRLDAPDAHNDAADTTSANPVRDAAPAGVFSELPHHLIQPDALNPRRAFDDEALAELADSIAAQGLMQNLVVRPDAPLADGSPCALHRLVSGERRWRAIGLLIDRGDWPVDRPVPVQIRAMDDNDHALAALVENLQRVDLNPLEEAQAFDRLVAGHGWTTAQVADKVNKTQRFVQQRLQLNQLNDKEKAMLLAGDLSVGDARKRLANRPEPLVLTPAQALVIAEVIAAMGDEVSAWHLIECDPVALADPVLIALTERNLLTVRGPAYDTGIFTVGFFDWSAFEQVKIHHPDLLKPDTLLATRAAAAGSDAAEQADTEGRYLTPWLNGPFELTPEGQACVELTEARAADYQQEVAQRDADEVARRQARLEVSTRAIELVAAMSEGEHQAQAVAKTLEDTGAPLPWRFVEPEHPDQSGRLLDANNREVDLRAWNGGMLANARTRLIMAAINAAADLDPIMVSHAEHEALLQAERAQAEAGAAEVDYCIACDDALNEGDLVLNDAEGGLIHAACCGPERDSYFTRDGEPLGPDDPIPTPFAYAWVQA